MKKIIFLFLVSLMLMGSSDVFCADSVKIITLQDGSRLKGKIVGLENNAYAIQTVHLGLVHIPESNVISIVSEESLPAFSSTDQIKNQVGSIQGKILADPGLMVDIRDIAQDKNILELLNDKELLNDVLSYDPKRIENNSKIQALIKNPKMQNLINKISPSSP